MMGKMIYFVLMIEKLKEPGLMHLGKQFSVKNPCQKRVTFEHNSYTKLVYAQAITITFLMRLVLTVTALEERFSTDGFHLKVFWYLILFMKI